MNQHSFLSAAACEALEQRHLMAAAAMEVWGGNTDYLALSNSQEYFYNIDAHGYTRLGTTSASNTLKTGAESRLPAVAAQSQPPRPAAPEIGTGTDGLRIGLKSRRCHQQ